jgi:hypothetical protein
VAEVVLSQGFLRGRSRAPVSVQRAAVAVIARMYDASVAGPFEGDVELALPPTMTLLWEHAIPGAGWSLLYGVTADRFIVRYLCQTPAR